MKINLDMVTVVTMIICSALMAVALPYDNVFQLAVVLIWSAATIRFVVKW